MSGFDLTRRAVAGLGVAALIAPHARAAARADAAFADLATRYIDQRLALSPVTATGLGDHRFDAELDDLSGAGRARRGALTRRFLEEAQSVRPADLSRENQVDLALLANQLRYDLWTDEVLQSWAWDPQLYSGVAGSALYSLMAREFAPLPVRMSAAISRMEKLPRCSPRPERSWSPPASRRSTPKRWRRRTPAYYRRSRR